jgi:hypothetical protein
MLKDEQKRSKLLKKIHSSAQRRAGLKGIDFTLAPDHVDNLWRIQQGRCAISGISFDDLSFDDALVKHAFAPSLDRKKSWLGYTPENTRLVCTCANFGMGEWGEEVLYHVARGMVRKETSPPVPSQDEEWLTRQRAKLAAAESLTQRLSGEQLRDQRRRIAALKRSITLGPEGLRRAAERARSSRRVAVG